MGETSVTIVSATTASDPASVRAWSASATEFVTSLGDDRGDRDIKRIRMDDDRRRHERASSDRRHEDRDGKKEEIKREGSDGGHHDSRDWSDVKADPLVIDEAPKRSEPLVRLPAQNVIEKCRADCFVLGFGEDGHG